MKCWTYDNFLIYWNPIIRAVRRRVAIETYGCTMNQADSDIIRAEISGEFEVSSTESADIVILNSCGVIEFTERKILKRAAELKKAGKTVVIAGCLPRIAPKKVREVADSAISPDNVHRICEAVNAAVSGKSVFIIERASMDKTRCKKLRTRKGIATVSIAEGCTGRCTFCATRFARGRLRSFSPEGIVEEIRKAVAEGYVEIQLTSQDTGAYGHGNDTNLSELLEKISSIEGKFRVRVGMMNPHHAYGMLDELLNAFGSEKIYKFLHLPVQSGDEKVLRDMGRDHSVEEFEEVVSAFRKRFDDVVISTDVIAGFPTESEEAFYRTFELIRRIKPDLLNITRYSPRKGTPAYRLKDLPGWVKKERSRALTRLQNRIQEKKNASFVGRTFDVIATKFDGELLARTNAYRPVVLRHGRVGEFYRAKIVGSTTTHLLGERIF